MLFGCTRVVMPASLDLQVLLRQRLALLHIEAPVVDRALARLRPRVLHEEHEAARLGGKILLEVRVGVEDHRARAQRPVADLERALEDVPDLRKIVTMARMVGTGLVAHKTRVGLARSLWPRAADHLALLPGAAHRRPSPSGDVAR